MSYYQSNAPPKLWSQLSKKKKLKYMECMKQLYGEKNAKESKDQHQTIPKEESSKI